MGIDNETMVGLAHFDSVECFEPVGLAVGCIFVVVVVDAAGRRLMFAALLKKKIALLVLNGKKECSVSAQ